MKKLFRASLLTVGLSISVMAADLVPTDHKGNVTLPEYAGVNSCQITSSTGTNAVLCDTGAGILLGIYGSSVAATDQLVVRDSATANTSSTRLLIVDLTALSKPAQLFPRYKNGLSVNASISPTPPGVANTPAWTVIYRALD